MEKDCTDGNKDEHSFFRKRLDKRGVDIMLERLWLSVHNKEGNEVKLFDYLSKDEGDKKISGKKSDKGVRELRNLK